MKFSTPFRLHISILLLGTPFIAGCQHMEHINVAQITYEMLRADDCRRNNLEDFCGRTYAAEYHDYVRRRQDFIRSEEQVERLGQPDSASTLAL